MRTAVVNFNSGEMTPKVDARADTEKYAGGCRQSDNMLPSMFGGSEKRPGTEFIKSNSAFDTVMDAIVSYEEAVVCDIDEVITTDFHTMLAKIICNDYDVVCNDNEVVTDGDMAFLDRAVCYENELVFYEGDVVYV